MLISNMVRLPNPGGDENVWGDLLNNFLEVEHSSGGELKIRTDGTLDAFVRLAGAQTVVGTKTFTTSPVVPTPTTDSQAANKSYVDDVAGDPPDATAAQKGIVQLTGDLGGTATSPIVPALANKQDANADLTAISGLSPNNDDVLQRKAGAWSSRTPSQLKTDLSLAKEDVGLANVDNTSDANKPVSTDTQAALDQKANQDAVVLRAGGNAVAITNPALSNGFIRVDLDYTPESGTPDALAFYLNGVRTGYHNEKGELRARPAANNSVPFRVQQRSSSQSANLTEWTTSGNDLLAWVDPNGVITAPNVDRKVSYGVTAPGSPREGDLWIVP